MLLNHVASVMKHTGHFHVYVCAIRLHILLSVIHIFHDQPYISSPVYFTISHPYILQSYRDIKVKYTDDLCIPMPSGGHIMTYVHVQTQLHSRHSLEKN